MLMVTAMNEVIIKIPRNKKKLTIIRNKDVVDKEIEKRRELLNSLLELKKRQEEQNNIDNDNNVIKEKVPVKTVFTEVFTISNSNQPTKIEFFAPTEPLIDWDLLEQEIQSAYDRGFKDGVDVTKNLAERDLDKMRKMNRTIDAMVDSFKSEYLKQMQKLKSALVELSVNTAQQIIGYEIDKSDNFFLSQLKRIVDEIDKALIYKVFVNPADIEIFQESKSKLIEDSSLFDNTKLIADENVEHGFCRLKTSIGEFDGTLKTQIERMRENMLNEVENIRTIEEFEQQTIAPQERDNIEQINTGNNE